MNSHAFASRGFNGPPRPSNQSSLHAVVEGAKVFGNQNAISPKAQAWKGAVRKHAESLRQVHWEETGRWRNFEVERAPKGSRPKPVKRMFTSRKELKGLV